MLQNECSAPFRLNHRTGVALLATIKERRVSVATPNQDGEREAKSQSAIKSRRQGEVNKTRLMGNGINSRWAGAKWRYAEWVAQTHARLGQCASTH